MIVLVLSMHAADTYSTLGNWYYQEKSHVGHATLFAFWTYQAFLQAFFMGLLFFLAGYFVPRAFDRKGARAFLRDRWKRLGTPTLFYVFILGPLTEYYIAGSWRPNPRISFLHEWIIYIERLRFPGGTGPMWFCAALLIFCWVYVLVRPLLPRQPSGDGHAAPPSNGMVLSLVVAIAAVTFCVRLVQPSNTSLYNMHLADFSQYVLLFGAGILAYRRRWLERIPFDFGVRWLVAALVLGAVIWLCLAAFGGAAENDFARYGGGLYWQSAAMNFWESLVCVGMCLGLIVVYREHVNTAGRFATFLADNAFAVYLFHPPILIAIALALRGVLLPPAIKVVVLTVLTAIASFGLSAAMLRRTPVLRAML